MLFISTVLYSTRQVKRVKIKNCYNIKYWTMTVLLTIIRYFVSETITSLQCHGSAWRKYQWFGWTDLRIYPLLQYARAPNGIAERYVPAYIALFRPWASLKQEIVCDLIFYETYFAQFPLKAIRTFIRIFNSELGKRKCQLVDDEIFIVLLRCRFDVNCYVGIPFRVDEDII